MSRAFRFPLAASLVGHAGLLVLLALLVGRVALPPLPLPAAKSIEILLQAPTPEPQPIPSPPQAEAPPAEPPPAEPPPQVAEPAPAPPPPPAPVHRVIAKSPPPHRPAPQRVRERPPEPAYRPPQIAPPIQAAAVPRPPPPPAGPVVSAAYRGALSAWLESHKRYPDSARARGEEGRAVLRFRVERSGRVIEYAVVQSTGYPDLDAAIDQMMRGATLPPFPADMTASDIEVSVTVRFALAR